MTAVLEYLRQFNFVTAVLRVVLAALCGAAIGYGRSKKQRAAGLRTYMLICIGAAMAVLITLYEYAMLTGGTVQWTTSFLESGQKFDASRLASQVVTGIGFLGAGIIIKVAHQQVSGLTTATGLFASVCLGLACGVGFYECVIISLVVIIVVLNVMSPLEVSFKRRLRNITLYVEFTSVEDIQTITKEIQDQHATVYDIDVERTERVDDKSPSAIFILKLSKENHSHSGMLTSLAELPCVNSVRELIA